MKKLLLGSVMSVLMTAALIPATVSAQETNLGDILVRFCNDEASVAQGGTKALQGESTAGESFEICMLVSNTSNDPVKVGLNFVDGTVTADASQKKACKPEGSMQQFGQYVELEEREYDINPGKTVQVYANATFPAGYAGMSYGCVTSQLLAIGDEVDEAGEDSMFEIVSRRANFIDILVDGEIELGLDMETFEEDSFKKNLTKSKELGVYLDKSNDNYFTSLTFTNPGTVKQDAVVTVSVTDILGNTTVYDDNKVSILPKQSATQTVDISETIKWYQGIYTVDVTIEHTPTFDFESDLITDDMLERQTITVSDSFMLIPWMILGGVAVLILILLIATSSKKKED